MATKDLVKHQQLSPHNDKTGIIPFSDSLPDYVPANVKNTGIDNLDKDDFKTPRIILLQALSPQLQSFPETAKAGHFWHTGLNVSLGEDFIFTPIMASKRVILYRPRGDQEGGMLAFSRNAKDWDVGANQKFSIKLKGKKEPVLWETKDNVANSGLTEWGSHNPEDDSSPPAATIIYEYLCYLPNNPELSPCVMGVSKTGLANGKNFNTSLLTISRSGKPIYCLAVKAFAEEETNSEGTWTIPNFSLLGYASRETLDIARGLADTYANYTVEYAQEAEPIIQDEIKY